MTDRFDGLTSRGMSDLLTGLGWVVCPVMIRQEGQTYKKIIGHNGIGIKKKIEQFTLDDYDQNKEIWFSDPSTGIGIICCQGMSVEGSWIIKLDLDCKGISAEESIRLKSKFFERFETSVFSTVSGGLGALLRCDFYVNHGVKIWFDNEFIGNTSDFNVLPPTVGYEWVKDLDLEKVWTREELEGIGIRFGSENSATRVDAGESIWDIERYCHGLRLLELAWKCGIKGSRGTDGRWEVYGYDDTDYQQWISLLLIGRGLDQQHGGERCKDAFHAFSMSCGDNRYDAVVIEQEWEREDTGELTVATLEEWVKGIWETDRSKTKLDHKTLKEFENFVKGSVNIDSYGVARNKFFESLWFSRFDRHRVNEALWKLSTDYDREASRVESDWKYYRKTRSQDDKLETIPTWHIDDSVLEDILRSLPGGEMLWTYGSEKGVRPSVYVPLYLTLMPLGVHKSYRRLSMLGAEITGVNNTFCIANSGDGKSPYSRIFNCLGSLQLAKEQFYVGQFKAWQADVARIKNRNKKTEEQETIPDPPIMQTLMMTDFTYPALLDAQEGNKQGALIYLDEASPMFSVDNSGMKQSNGNLMGSYCRIWNRELVKQNRRSRGVSFSIDVKAGFIGNLQTAHLKGYLRNDINGFFARSWLIGIESVKEGNSQFSEPEVQAQLRSVYEKIHNYYQGLGFSNPIDLINGDRYPNSEIVQQFLDDVYDIAEQIEDVRRKFLMKVRAHFWNIVYALETIYSSHSLEIDWNDLYAKAIAIAKWLCDEYESVMCLVGQAEEIDTSADVSGSLEQQAYKDLRTWFRKNPTDSWSIAVNGLRKRAKYKRSTNAEQFREWQKQWIAEGKVTQQENKQWIFS
jgi:Protein of unknown function (DUF3987)